MRIAWGNQAKIGKLKWNLHEKFAVKEVPTHTGYASTAKPEVKNTPTLPIRLHTKGGYALQHGEHEANTNSTSNDNPTIRQRLSFHRRGEKAQWKYTLRIGCRKYHVRFGGDLT